MRPITWTKQTLTEALNIRVDQGKLTGDNFIMANEISNEVLSEWQEFHDANRNEHAAVEAKYIEVYDAVIASFK